MTSAPFRWLEQDGQGGPRPGRTTGGLGYHARLRVLTEGAGRSMSHGRLRPAPTPCRQCAERAADCPVVPPVASMCKGEQSGQRPCRGTIARDRRTRISLEAWDVFRWLRRARAMRPHVAALRGSRDTTWPLHRLRSRVEPFAAGRGEGRPRSGPDDRTAPPSSVVDAHEVERPHDLHAVVTPGFWSSPPRCGNRSTSRRVRVPPSALPPYRRNTRVTARHVGKGADVGSNRGER